MCSGKHPGRRRHRRRQGERADRGAGRAGRGGARCRTGEAARPGPATGAGRRASAWPPAPAPAPKGNAARRRAGAGGGGPGALRPAPIFVSPLARRMARQAGIDLSTLKGSGPNGRIVRADIDGAQAKPAPTQAPAAAPAPAARAPAVADRRAAQVGGAAQQYPPHRRAPPERGEAEHSAFLRPPMDAPRLLPKLRCDRNAKRRWQMDNDLQALGPRRCDAVDRRIAGADT